MSQCAKLLFEFKIKSILSYLQQMGKKQIEQPKKTYRAGHKAIKHSRIPPATSCRICQFDENEPLGLAKIFKNQKQQVTAMFLNPQISVIHRDKEKEAINNFVQEVSSCKMRGCKCLMVTGKAGLGKSLSVNTVLDARSQKIIKIDSNKVTSFKDAQLIIYNEMIQLSKRDPPIINQNSPTQRIINRLANQGATQTVIVYIDTINTLFNGPIDYASIQFLKLFTTKQLNIGLIGVGGTISQFNSYIIKVKFLNYPIKNIIFQSYSKQAIMHIVKENISIIKTKFDFRFYISEQVLQIAVSKMMAITNDVRIMISYLQKVILLKLETYQRRLPIYPQADDHESWVFTIQEDNLQAIKKEDISHGSLVCSLPVIQQVILVGLSRTLNEEELLYINEERAFVQIKEYLIKANIASSTEQIKIALKEIQSYGLIKIQKKGHQRRIMLMVGSEDLKWCLQDESDIMRVLNGSMLDGSLQMIDNLC